MDERLSRTPQSQVFLNAGTLRGLLRKVGLNMLIRELAKAHDKLLDRVFDRAHIYMLGEGSHFKWPETMIIYALKSESPRVF